MVSRVNNFNWDKIIKKMDFADAQRSLQLLRGKANEIEVLILILFLLIIIFDDYNTHIIIYNNHNYYPSLLTLSISPISSSISIF